MSYLAMPRVPASLVLVALLWPAPAPSVAEPAAPPALRWLAGVRSSYPHPSPDGSRVVFQSDRTGRWEIFVAGVGGTGLRQLTDRPGDNVTPKWSPDGTRIVFAASPEGQSDVFVMSADGSAVRRLTDHPGDDSHPQWFPDGSRIVFNSSRTTPDPAADWARQWHEVFSMAPDGGDLRQHTRCRSVCTYPAVSPDGRRLAFRKVVDGPGLQWDLTPGERNSEVFVAALDGSDERNLSRNGAFDGWPAWRPDGAAVVFASNRTGPALVASLWIAELTATEARPFLQARGDWGFVQPAFTRDGKQVFVYSDNESLGSEIGSVVVVELPTD